MAQYWPTSLPSQWLVDAFSESPGDNLVRQDMSMGPPKVRRRSTAAYRPITNALILDSDELSVFDNFYETILQNGALTFNRQVPREDYTLVNTVASINDLSEWWTATWECSISNPAIIASSDDETHGLTASSKLLSATEYKIKTRVKSGDVNWCAITFYDDDGYTTSYFNAATGALGTIWADNASISGPDSDSYSQIEIEFTTGSISVNNAVILQPAYADTDNIFAGDGSTPSIYVKDFYLYKVTQVEKELRFSQPPQYTPLGGDYWRVAIVIEVLP
jgi:hypothetical protein